MVLPVGLVAVPDLLDFMVQQDLVASAAWGTGPRTSESSVDRSRDSVVGRAEQHRSQTAQQRRTKIRAALLLQVCAMAAAHPRLAKWRPATTLVYVV